MVPNRGIEIALKPTVGGANRILPSGFNQVLQYEYAAKYLENIGANPTKDNVEFVLNNLAIKDALVLPVWAREKIVIIPGMEGKLAEYQHALIDTGANASINTAPKKPTVSKVVIKTKGEKTAAQNVKKVMFDNISVDNNDNDSACSVDSNERGSRRRRKEKKKGVGHSNSSSGGSGDKKLSWATAHTLDLLQPLVTVLKHHRRTAESFKSLLTAPVFDRDDLMAPVQLFVSSLVDYVPQVKNDATGKLFKAIRRLLTSDKCIRLFGLLAHFCYWNTIHPAARATVRLLRDTQPAVFEDADLSPQMEGRVIMAGVPSHSQRNQPSQLDLLQQHLRLSASDSGGQFHADLSEEEEEGEDSHPLTSIDELFAMEMRRGEEKEEADFDLQTRRGQHGELTIAAEEDVNSDDENVPITAASHRAIDPSEDCPRLNPRDLQSICSVATEASLSAFEKEQLFMQLEACLISVFSKSGTKIAALVSSRQALVSCAHFVVDDIFTTEYPWFSSLSDKGKEQEQEEKAEGKDAQGRLSRKPVQKTATSAPIQDPALTSGIRELNLRLRRLVHRALSDIVDPSRLYTSNMLLTALVGNEARFLTSNMMGRAKYYGTSVAIKAVLGDTTSYKARKFFQRTDKLHSTLPGVVDPYADPNPVEEAIEQVLKKHYSMEQRVASAQYLGPQDSKRAHSPLAVNIGRRPGTFSGEPAADSDKHSSLHGFARTTNHSTWDRRTPSSSEGSRHRPIPRQLDFNNIFANQPEAHYFPNPIEPQLHVEEVAAVVEIVTNAGGSFAQNMSLSNPFTVHTPLAVEKTSALLSKSISSPGLDAALSRTNSTRTQLDIDVLLVSAILNKQSLGAISDGGALKTRRFHRIQSTMNSHQYVNPPSETPLFVNQQLQQQQQQLGSSQFQRQFDLQLDQQCLPFQQQQLYSSSGSVDSASLVSDNRSLAFNKNAKMSLSLKAKASLMTLVTNKAAHTYAAQPKTSHTLNRVALIQSGAHHAKQQSR